MKHSFWSGALLGLAAALLSPPAAAQSWSDPGIGFGARLGLGQARSADSPSAEGAIHVRYRLTGSLGIEGSLGIRRETVGDGDGPLLRLTEAPVTGTGLIFFFPRRRLQPYLLAGAGLHVVRAEPDGRNPASGAKTEALFAVHAGAGIDVRPSRASAVHLDARWTFLEPTSIGDLEKAGFDVAPGYWSVALGVTFYR
ncbi:MAG: outer membrane beta-barrel protein [Thermoanaerobaculia bacterium]